MKVSERIERMGERAVSQAQTVEKGKTVVVYKGRKVAPGTTGVVFWTGEGRSYRPRYSYQSQPNLRVGVKSSDGTSVFVDAEHVKVVDPENYLPDWADIVARAQHPIADEDTRTRAECEEAIAWAKANMPETLDYLGDMVHCEGVAAKAVARIKELDETAAESAAFNARWVEHKNEYARRECEQERAAFLSDEPNDPERDYRETVTGADEFGRPLDQVGGAL